MAAVLAEARLRVEGGAAPGAGHADGQAAGGAEARIDIQGAATPAAAHGGMLRAATGRRCRMADTWPACPTGQPRAMGQAGRAAAHLHYDGMDLPARRLRHRYQVRFDEADAQASTAALGLPALRPGHGLAAQRGAGFGRDWYAERSLSWLVRNVSLH